MDPTLIQTFAIISMIIVGALLLTFTVVGIIGFSNVVKRGINETRLTRYRRDLAKEIRLTNLNADLKNTDKNIIEENNNAKYSKQKVI